MGCGKEKEINLFDLLWAVCLKWRSILVCATILAVVAGAVSYVGSRNEMTSYTPSRVITSEEKYAAFSYEDKKSVGMYFDYKGLYDDLCEYRDSAPLMQLDYKKYYVGEISCYVDNGYQIEYPMIDSSNNIMAITEAYEIAVNKQEVAQKVKEIIGEDCENASAMELIDCRANYAGENYVSEDKAAGIFSVVVYAQDEQTCTQLKELVKDVILAEKTAVENKFGEHEISIIQETVVENSDTALLARQKDIFDKIQSCSNSMNALDSKFTEEQKSYVALRMKEANGEAADQATTQPAAPAEEPKGTVDPQMVLLGFLGGLFLMFAIWAFAYIFSGKIRLEDEFEASFDCKYIGNVPSSDKKKKKWFGFIDAFFTKLRHFNKRYFAREEALDMAAANLRIAAAKAGAKQIMVTGALCGEAEKKLAEELSKRLKKDGVEVVFEKPVLYDAEALEKLVKIGHVVLAEKAEASLRTEIAKEIEICRQQDVNLMGCIVVY